MQIYMMFFFLCSLCLIENIITLFDIWNVFHIIRPLFVLGCNDVFYGFSLSVIEKKCAIYPRIVEINSITFQIVLNPL